MGLVIIVGVIVPLYLVAYLREDVPPQQREAEYLLLEEVKRDFFDLKTTISELSLGEAKTVNIGLGTLPPTPLTSEPLSGTLRSTLPRYVSQTDPTDDAYVDNADNDTNFGGGNFLLVSPTLDWEKRTYLKFDLRDVYKLYDPYNYEFEEDVVIQEAKLWLYCEDLDLAEEPGQELEAQVPVTVEVRAIEYDSWTEGTITWNNAPDPTNAEILENETVDGEDEWYSWDVTSYVKGLHNELVENQIKRRPLNDNFVSFVLCEPRSRGSSSLRRLATFTSKDHEDYEPWDHPPSSWQDIIHLEVVFTRSQRLGYAQAGLVDAGWIEYKPSDDPSAQRAYPYPNHQYVYEGGAIIQTRGSGWYDIMISAPSDFITVAPAGGDTVYVTVKRYRIANGVSISGVASASVGISEVAVDYLVSSEVPNYDEVTITISTDNPGAWREYLEQRAAELNDQLGGEWDPYGAWATYNYNRISITIRGKVVARGIDDIIYNEVVIDLGVDFR